MTASVTYGGIAQLGERLNGIQEVSGSIPLISTTFKFRNLMISELFSFYFIIFALYCHLSVYLPKYLIRSTKTAFAKHFYTNSR